MSLRLPWNLRQFYNPHIMCLPILKYWRNLVQYLLRYVVRYADFCHLVPKVTETPGVISGVSGPIFTKIAQNVAKYYYFTPVSRNCAIRIQRFEWRSFRQFAQKIGCTATSLEKSKKAQGQLNKIHANKCLSFGGKYSENRSSISWNNLLNSKKN